MSDHMAPVTDVLSSAMAQTRAALKAANDRGSSNDKDHFAEMAAQLEVLTLAVLSASSSLPLIGVRPAGARFDIGAGTALADRATDCVTYLRGEASALLLTGSSLGAYDTKNFSVALSYLGDLYSVALAAITAQARADLTTIANASSYDLIQAATFLAELAQVAVKPKVK